MTARWGGWPGGAIVLATLAGCGGDAPVAPAPPPPPPAQLSCASPAPVALGPGEFAVVDPAATSGCIELPDPGGSGAEYLVTLVSAAGQSVAGGISAPFVLRAGTPGHLAAAAVMSAPTATATTATATPDPIRLHDWLRLREQNLSADASTPRPLPAPAAPTVVPAIGDVRTFKVCGAIPCTRFVDVIATARSVGQHAAIYLDRDNPTADSLQTADIDELRDTFDRYHYPIDVQAFGAESDIDHNGVVVILLTKAINDLTPNCSNGRILGYFFGGDLLPGTANSNGGEVFYAFVPSPATGQCPSVSRATAVRALKPTLIHEFQHMISFNQHALVRGGASEVTWLNEGLSHYAEELGGMLIPPAACPDASSCRSLYASGDLFNAYDYLAKPDASYLIYPSESTGTLPERGASWLFVRWLADQFGTDSVAGNLTRAADGTAAQGSQNVTQLTGEDFAELVTEWHLAVYLDDLPGFVHRSPRTSYRSWGFRSVFTDPRNAQVFPDGFPLVPDSTTGSYSRSGTLRGGSGVYLKLALNGGTPIDIGAFRNGSGAPLDNALAARFGIARIR